MSVEEISQRALQLPRWERELLLQDLLQSLDSGEIPDAERAELRRRIEEIDSGKVEGIPPEETLRRARAASAEHAKLAITSGGR